MGLVFRTFLAFCLMAPLGLAKAGVPEDWQSYLDGRYQAALAGLRPKAESGDAAAQFAMGSLYCDGLAVARSYRQARTWFEKAARQGHPEAELVLAMMLHDGAGAAEAEDPVEPDLEAALPWLEAAAASGQPMAQLLLARLFHYGEGVARDDGRAADLAVAAARRGLAGAQFEAGTLLGDRLGDRAAWIQAYAWLLLAADAGHPAAVENLEILARRLRPEEIRQAETRARSWAPEKG